MPMVGTSLVHLAPVVVVEKGSHIGSMVPLFSGLCVSVSCLSLSLRATAALHLATYSRKTIKLLSAGSCLTQQHSVQRHSSLSAAK